MLPFDQPFTTARALDLGLSANQLSRLVREGVLRRVFRGVYVDAAAEDTLATRARALLLVTPPSAVVTDECAAWARGVDLLARGDHVIPPPLSICQPLDRTRVRQRDTDGRRRMLTAHDVEVGHGVRRTTSLRTAMDLARTRSRPRGIAALDALLRTGDFAHADLLRDLDRFRGFRGVVRLRALAPLADARAESPAESAMRLIWVDAGLPRVTSQISVRSALGTEVYRLDMGLPELRYAAEYDGLAWHSSPSQRAHDRARRAWLRDREGWDIDVLGKDEVFTHPLRAVEILRAGVARAERRYRRAG
ncbi:MAG: type IV toxin-antitoxin system AbiEi family antitoxin domain-containing protein [Nocardioidaceae bacterium]